MADFFVLEEDGTSHLEVEESSSDFLSEESGGAILKAGPGVAGLKASGVGPPAPIPSYATWKAGKVVCPSSTGTQAVTGLGGTPAAVILFGTNFSTEDSAFSTGGSTGVTRGMAAPAWNSPGTLHETAAFVSPAGDQSRATGGIVNSLTNSGTASAVDVAATVVSLDADGFTLSYSVVTSGRPFAWLALMDVQNVGSIYGSTQTVSPGWKAGAMLCHGAWQTDYTANGEAGEWWGGAAYPGVVGGGNWPGAGLAASGYPNFSSQWNIGLFNNAAATSVTQGSHMIGPSMVTDNITAYPSGGSLTDFTIGTGTANGGQFVFWDDEDTFAGSVTPGASTGNTVTVSGLPFAPGLVIFYSISDEPSGQGSFGSPIPGAVGMGLATDTFQYCNLVDANTRGSFQSFQRGFADGVNSTSVHAGTVELTADGFILTTEEDDVSANPIVWHAFGHPEQFPTWIPQSYRRRN